MVLFMHKFLFSDNNVPYYNVSCAPIRSITDTKMHLHDYYEIEIFLGGDGETVINQSKYKVHPGSVFLITPADIHSYKFVDGASVLSIAFTPDVLEYSPFLEILYPMQHISASLSDADIKTLINYIDRIKEECDEKKQFGKKYISMLLSCLLIDLYRSNENNANIAEHSIPYHLPVQKALYYMRSHF